MNSSSKAGRAQVWIGFPPAEGTAPLSRPRCFMRTSPGLRSRVLIRISGNSWTRVCPSISGHATYRAGEAGAQATAQSERIRPWLVANRFQAISQASMTSARLGNTELASQWLRRWCQIRSTGLSSGL